ncbi:MAG: transcription antitermination factor NusB, partial [Betaproteobacteria bacterium]|nr:transcription antitermination factor NusB [Betaproteobacteria bacterium]
MSNPSSTPAPAPSPAKSARRKARELALQGLFEWLLAGSDSGAIDAFLRERYPTIKLDRELLDALLHGCIREAPVLDEMLQPLLDRPSRELSPVEHALLLLGAYEMRFLPEVPYKVIINEAVDLAKVYGGTDGFKYVNGVLDRLALSLRPAETGHREAREPAAPAQAPLSRAASVPVSIKPRSTARPAPRAGASRGPRGP